MSSIFRFDPSDHQDGFQSLGRIIAPPPFQKARPDEKRKNEVEKNRNKE